MSIMKAALASLLLRGSSTSSISTSTSGKLLHSSISSGYSAMMAAAVVDMVVRCHESGCLIVLAVQLLVFQPSICTLKHLIQQYGVECTVPKNDDVWYYVGVSRQHNYTVYKIISLR